MEATTYNTDEVTTAKPMEAIRNGSTVTIWDDEANAYRPVGIAIDCHDEGPRWNATTILTVEGPEGTFTDVECENDEEGPYIPVVV